MASWIIEVVGWSGTALVLLAFLMLQTRRLGPSSWAYLWMNFFGALLIGLNSYFNDALPSVALNLAWMVIAVYGMAKSVRNRKARQATLQESRGSMGVRRLIIEPMQTLEELVKAPLLTIGADEAENLSEEAQKEEGAYG